MLGSRSKCGLRSARSRSGGGDFLGPAVMQEAVRQAPQNVAAGRAHFRDLDGLRGLLALSVVLLHLGFNSFTFRTFGWKGVRFELAVDVFFLLSGFVLTHAAREGVALVQFILRRFLRLAPVFFSTTLLLAAFSPHLLHPMELAMAMPFLGRDPANFPAWSICWEFYLPIAAVSAGAIGLRIPAQFVRPLLIAALLGLGFFDVREVAGEHFYLMRAVLGLSAGYLLYRARLTLGVRLEVPFVLLGAIMAGASYWPPLAMLLPFGAALCIASGRSGGSLFASPPLQWLGRISYPLYLLHIPLLVAAGTLLGGKVDTNAPMKLAILGASLLGAWLLTILIEQPFMRLSARLIRSPSWRNQASVIRHDV
jgi:peptidoglycan/LPS O-acetylase OafA/YrhL